MSETKDRVVIVNGVRTPFSRARTLYKKMPASALGGIVLRETVTRSGIDPKLIGEVYFGTAAAPAEGTNVGREALFDSGLSPEIPCATINRYCASSLEAAAAIDAKITAGQIEVGLAGGVESVSSVQALFSLQATDFFQDVAKAKTTTQRLSKLSEFKPGYLAPHAPGIYEPTLGLTMGQSADLMCRDFEISREEQDKYAVDTHQKTHQAWETGFYKSHVVAVGTPDGKVIERDTDVRPDSSMEQLSKLRPVFYKDGTITAGNASPLTDGASAIMLMKESKARELNQTILGTIRGYAVAAVDIQNEHLLIGPAMAIPKALKSAGVTWSEIDMIEMHEAFAGQVLSTIKAIESTGFAKKKLGLDSPIGEVDLSKFNVHGGSIPIGHPFGATGTRLILQTLHGLRARKKNLGLISCCAAGGLGAVMIIEAI